MHPDHTKTSPHRREIEFLAQESQVSIDEVMQLYEHEWAALETGAQLTRFLPIFTTRNVRATLRERSEIPRGIHPLRARKSSST